MSRGWRLSRRAFLGGAAVTVGLPMLEAMLPRRLRTAQGGAAPELRRLLCYFVPNGIDMRNWTPARTGAGFDLPDILQPLADLQDDILVLSGIQNYAAQSDGGGDHASGTASFLTAQHPFKTEGENISNGISMDQVAAGVLGDRTPRRRSLQLGTVTGTFSGDCDSGYSCAYVHNISWADAQTPLPKIIEPGEVFDLLFAGFEPGTDNRERERRARLKTSVLDYVRDDAERLQRRLGKTDRQKMEQYLTSVRELEAQIQASSQGGDPICDPGTRPGGYAGIEEQRQQMHDLMVLAFQCDATAVITFMLHDGGRNPVYDFLGAGINRGHHEISHHQGNAEALEQLRVIDIWELEGLAYLLGRMRDVSEPTENDPDATLLDNSLVYFSSEIEDGNSHAHGNLPILLAGKCGGALRTGRHVVYDNDPPLANLYISMLDAVGAHVDSFGRDGTGPIDQLS